MNSPKNRHRLAPRAHHSAFLVSACALALCAAGRAADGVWAGTATGTWATAGNWTGGVPGTATSATTATNTDLATFGAAGTFANINWSTSAYNVGSVLVTGSSAPAYNFWSGSTGTGTSRLYLTLGGGVTVASDVAQTQTFARVGFSGATGEYTFANNAATTSAALVFASTIANNSSGAATLNLAGTNTGANQITNVISNAGSGSLALAKSGAGTWQLTAANTYGGGTTLNAGTLLVGNNAALGGGTLAINGGTLASVTSARTLGNNVTVGGNFALGGAAQPITLNGAVDLGGAVRTVTLNNSATLGGAIGNGGLTLESSSSARSLTLGVANTFAGGLTVNGGTLVANHTGALGGGAVTVSGGTLDLLGAAAGTFVLGSGASFNLSSGVVRFTLGTSSDQIVGNAASFNLTGGTLELTLGEGFDYGATYHLLTSFTGGVVAGVAITGFDTGAYTATLSNVGVLSFAAVPEPASFASLAALGALGFAASRRRRG